MTQIRAFTNIKTVFIVQKIDLIQKYWVNFTNFKIKPFVGPFLSPKNLKLTSLKLYKLVLLVGPFAVRANSYFYFSQEINRFSRSFLVMNIKKCWFLESVVSFLSRHATLPFSVVRRDKNGSEGDLVIKFRGSGQDCRLKIPTHLMGSFWWTN